MTRKDYIILAQALRNALDASDPATAESLGVRNAIAHIGQALQVDNPRFDYRRFKDAVTL